MIALEVGQAIAVLKVQEARCIAAAEVIGRINDIQPETLVGDVILRIIGNDGEKFTLGHFGNDKWRFVIEDPLDADKSLVYSTRSPFYWVVPLD